MKTIDILVEELPKRGGWPNDSDEMSQSQFDCEIYTNSELLPDFYVGEHAEDNGIDNGVTREQYESALAYKNDGWIEWGGGNCPVVDGTLVDVRYRNGEENYHIRAGISFDCSGSNPDRSAENWDKDGCSWDIIAYRLHQPQEADLNDCIGHDAAPVWSGEGLPPVGCVCNVLYDEHEVLGNTWLKAKIISHDDGNVVDRWLEGNTEHTLFDYAINNRDYRPLRTEAERKRDAVVEQMIKIATIYTTKSLGLDLALNSIYDAIAAGKIPGVKLED